MNAAADAPNQLRAPLNYDCGGAGHHVRSWSAAPPQRGGQEGGGGGGGGGIHQPNLKSYRAAGWFLFAFSTE